MKWWKVVLSAIGGGVLGSSYHCIHEAATGGHCAFTFGSAILPGLLVGAYGLLNLFVKPPSQP